MHFQRSWLSNFSLLNYFQEPKAEDDQQLCRSVNHHLNRPLGTIYTVFLITYSAVSY